MLRSGWMAFRRDVRSTIPAQRVRTAILVAVIVAVCITALLLLGDGLGHWLPAIGATRSVTAWVLLGLCGGVVAGTICPLGPLLTGERLVRDTAVRFAPPRLLPYFGKVPLPIAPADRDAVIDSAERQRNWMVPWAIRSASYAVAFFLIGAALLTLRGLDSADPAGWLFPLYGVGGIVNVVSTLRRLGWTERTRLAALDLPPSDATPGPSRPGTGGSKLRLPGE